MHACGGARNRRQEGDVLIVSVLVAIVVNLALRSNAQGRIKVPGVCQLPILVGLGASAIAVVGNPEIEALDLDLSKVAVIPFLAFFERWIFGTRKCCSAFCFRIP